MEIWQSIIYYFSRHTNSCKHSLNMSNIELMGIKINFHFLCNPLTVSTFWIGNSQLLVQGTASGEHYRSCIQNTWCLQNSGSWWPWQDCFRWTKWRQQQSGFPKASYQRKADLPIPKRWRTFDIYTSLWQECLNQIVNYRLLWIWFQILIIYMS